MKVHRTSGYGWLLALSALVGSSGVAACGDDAGGSTSSEAGAAGKPAVDDGGEPASTGGVSSEGGTGAGGTPDRGGVGTGGEPSGYNPAGDEVQDFLNGLGKWAQPPAASVTQSDLPPKDQTKTVGGVEQKFSCSYVQHDIIADHDEILNFDLGSQYVLPGLILQGGLFEHGELAPVPFAADRRAPVKLYVNVAGTQDSFEIADPPTTGGLSDAVAQLQQRAEVAAGDNFAAKVSYSKQEVQSFEQLNYALGVDFEYDGPFVDAGFQLAFEHQDTQEKHTVVMKLSQDMYNISFAYDEFMRTADMFTDKLTVKDMEGLQEDGYVGVDNRPVFISSVTYGRMVVFTATSSKGESATKIQQALQLSYDSAIAGDTSISEEARAEAKKTVSELEIKVLTIGGNSDTVSTAISTGSWDNLFAQPDILSAVPLRYVVRSMSGNRPIARIGDTTQFTTSECRLIPKEHGWLRQDKNGVYTFKDVTSNQTGATWALTSNAIVKWNPLATTNFEQVIPFNGLDISVDNAGNLWTVNDKNELHVMLAGTTNLAKHTNGQAIAVASGAPGSFFLSKTYSDNQRDFWRISPTNLGENLVGLMDEAQFVSRWEYDRPANALYSFGYTSTQTVYIQKGETTNGLKVCNSTTDCGQLGGYGPYGTAVTQVSPSPDNVIYVVEGNKIRVFNNDLNKPEFKDWTGTQFPGQIGQLEAGFGTDHWMLDLQGALYRYFP
jgi:hypothetical protein